MKKYLIYVITSSFQPGLAKYGYTIQVPAENLKCLSRGIFESSPGQHIRYAFTPLEFRVDQHIVTALRNYLKSIIPPDEIKQLPWFRACYAPHAEKFLLDHKV